jgi:hypothetical protein
MKSHQRFIFSKFRLRQFKETSLALDNLKSLKIEIPIDFKDHLIKIESKIKNLSYLEDLINQYNSNDSYNTSVAVKSVLNNDKSKVSQFCKNINTNGIKFVNTDIPHLISIATNKDYITYKPNNNWQGMCSFYTLHEGRQYEDYNSND